LVLQYERGGLYQMIQKAAWDDREKLFVRACHQAISYTYGQLSANTKPGEQPNFEKVTIRLRTGLGRCKNASSFREFITDFWARAGRNGFALTPDRLKDKSRTIAVLEGLTCLGEVGGNHSRFLYDFSPDSLVLRWTHDFSPRMLYCFAENQEGEITLPDLMRRVEAEDISSNELWVGGAIANSPDGETLAELGANVFPGIKETVEDLKERLASDLKLY
jgi:hypothetical protein